MRRGAAAHSAGGESQHESASWIRQPIAKPKRLRLGCALTLFSFCFTCIVYTWMGLLQSSRPVSGLAPNSSRPAPLRQAYSLPSNVVGAKSQAPAPHHRRVWLFRPSPGAAVPVKSKGKHPQASVSPSNPRLRCSTCSSLAQPTCTAHTPPAPRTGRCRVQRRTEWTSPPTQA